MHFRPAVFAYALLACALTSACVQTPRPATLPEPEKYLATLTVTADGVPVYDKASRSAATVATLRSGDRLRLLERQPEWLRVRTPSGALGYVEPSALIAPTCTADRPEPLIVEEPLFRFRNEPPHGIVVLEAEYSAEARLVATRVIHNALGDPAFALQAIEDLRGVRFLPPTVDCKPQPFFYTFTREF